MNKILESTLRQHLYTIPELEFIMKLLFLIVFLYSCFHCGHGKLCYAEPGMDTYNNRHNDCCFPEDGDSDFILGTDICTCLHIF